MTKRRNTVEIWEQARQIHRGIRQIHSKLIAQHCASGATSAIDLTMPQFRALMSVQELGSGQENEGVSLKDLAESLQVSSPSASSMADRLVELGLLVRDQNPDDRREIRLRLSSAGCNALEDFENRMLSMLVGLLEQLGPDLSTQWCAIYAQIEALAKSELIDDSHAVIEVRG